MIPTVIPGQRIVVVGVTGSGKTTVAQRLSQLLHVPHIELDALHWQPDWVQAELDMFRRLVDQTLSGPAWVVDGNYSKVRDLIWPRAATLVWLDYPLAVVVGQLTRRTIRRIITREVLWNSNRETIRGTFFSRDSLFLWVLKSYKRHRAEYPRLLSQPEHTHLQVVRLRSRRETTAWLKMVQEHSG